MHVTPEEYGVYNMDIKPENVMKTIGDCGVWKSIDWGVFEEAHSSAVRQGCVGTIGYMAPGETSTQKQSLN